MFTGIIEEVGIVKLAAWESGNYVLTIESGFVKELKVDQSIAHNGVCLTVVEILDENFYIVQVIEESVKRSTLGNLRIGDGVNLERCMKLNDRLDGHMVQGHVDTVVSCLSIKEEEGSWLFEFSYNETDAHLLVEKGSVTINGVSLTVASLSESSFTVAIIPYTFEHTTFLNLKEGMDVNIEFDIIGKYVSRILTRGNLT